MAATINSSSCSGLSVLLWLVAGYSFEQRKLQPQASGCCGCHRKSINLYQPLLHFLVFVCLWSGSRVCQFHKEGVCSCSFLFQFLFVLSLYFCCVCSPVCCCKYLSVKHTKFTMHTLWLVIAAETQVWLIQFKKNCSVLLKEWNNTYQCSTMQNARKSGIG